MIQRGGERVGGMRGGAESADLSSSSAVPDRHREDRRAGLKRNSVSIIIFISRVI